MWKSRVLFGFALGLSFLVIVFYERESVGLTLLYAVLMMLMFSAAAAISARLLVSVECDAGQETVFKGDSLPVQIRVINRGFFPYPKTELVLNEPGLLEYEGDDRAFPLPPLRTITRGCRITFPYRGVYQTGARSVELVDFFGLFRIVIPCRQAAVVTAFPRSDEDFVLSMRNEPQNASILRDPFLEDYSTVADVRKYEGSDSLRKIHWKLSAKRGELLSKNYEVFEPNRTLLLLDTMSLPLKGKPRAAFEDRMISYVASAVGYMMRGGLPADLIYGDQEIMPVDRSDSISRIFAQLSGIAFSGKKSVLSGLAEPDSACNIVLFLSGLDDETHDSIVSLISFDHTIILYLFTCDELPPEPKLEYLCESLRAYGVGVNSVSI